MAPKDLCSHAFPFRNRVETGKLALPGATKLGRPADRGADGAKATSQLPVAEAGKPGATGCLVLMSYFLLISIVTTVLSSISYH